MAYIVLSKKKLDEIVKEINELNKIRPEILKQVDEAIQLGDLSENAEYIEAKRKLRENDHRCFELNNILKNATIQDENKTKKDYVDIFANVVLKRLDDESTSEYTLVSEEESSLLDNRISISSPLGSALKHKKINDIISINVPKGILKYQIMNITY